MLREILRSRELLYFLVWRDIKVRYKQTALGAAWAVLQPLLTMIIFTVFFGRLAKIDTGGVPYPVFSYAALVPWTFFASALVGAGNSLLGNVDLLTKVYFPRAIIPAAAVIAGLVDLAIASVLLVFLMPYYGIVPDATILAWPVAIALLVLLAIGAGMFLAAISVTYRDVKHALPFAVQMLLFVTPVIYPSTIVPEAYRPLLSINPLTGIIEACRASLLPGRAIDWGQLGISAVITFAILAVGIAYFRRTERRFADVI